MMEIIAPKYQKVKLTEMTGDRQFNNISGWLSSLFLVMGRKTKQKNQKGNRRLRQHYKLTRP